MVKFKITYDRANCIGAGACAAMDPAHFEMAGDGKANLKGGNEAEGKFVLETDENPVIVEAAKACPVEVINVKNLDTNEDIV